MLTVLFSCVKVVALAPVLSAIGTLEKLGHERKSSGAYREWSWRLLLRRRLATDRKAYRAKLRRLKPRRGWSFTYIAPPRCAAEREVKGKTQTNPEEALARGEAPMLGSALY